MTNLEALKARVGYPLSDTSLEYVLTKRSIDKDEIWMASTDAQSFNLAYADALMVVLTAPSMLTEGGFTIQSLDRKFIMETANAIYKEYGEASFIPTFKPTATFVQKW